MDRKKELLVRVYMVMMFFVVAACVILWRVVKVSVIEGDKWRKQGEVNVKWMPVEADRGSIYSEDGSVMATSLPFFEIRMDLKVPRDEVFKKGLDSLSLMLSRTVRKDKSAQEWKTDLLRARRNKEKNRYFYIAKDLTIDERDLVKRFPIFRKGRFGGGLIIKRYTKREKPFKGLAARTIGEDRENASKIGVEGAFDKFLTGETDQKLLKRIPPGVWIPVYDPTELEPKTGADIITTININMQDIAHHELLKTVQTYNAKGGVAIVMEVETGAIKAISNLRKLDSGLYGELYNDAIGTRAEPGSTFKLASVMALLEDGFSDLDTQVEINKGKKKFFDRLMRDDHPHNENYTDLRNAFEISSNVGISGEVYKHYGKKVMRKQFVDRLTQFGLNDKTGIEIVGEEKPFIKDPEKDRKSWYGTTIPWMAHGYELMLTPLQMLNLYNTVGNNGKMMKPYLVSAIEQDGEVIKKFRPVVLKERIAKEETISKAQELLEGVVLRGTARRLKSDKFSFTGKTGTTRVNYARQNEVKKYNASFAGYFPADNPKYSIMVVIYEPKGAFYGSAVAAPVFKAIAEKCFAINMELIAGLEDEQHESGHQDLPGKHAGYKKDFEAVFEYVGMAYEKKSRNKWVDVDPYEDRMLIDKKKLEKNKVPDVRGMGARDALYVLENLGLVVNLEGLGKVKTQSIKPGTLIDGQEIKIYLN